MPAIMTFILPGMLGMALLLELNQGIVFFLLLFRTWQVIENIASRGFTLLMIEITVGLLAIVPTLNVIACIESRTDVYVPKNQAK